MKPWRHSIETRSLQSSLQVFTHYPQTYFPSSLSFQSVISFDFYPCQKSNKNSYCPRNTSSFISFIIYWLQSCPSYFPRYPRALFHTSLRVRQGHGQGDNRATKLLADPIIENGLSPHLVAEYHFTRFQTPQLHQGPVQIHQKLDIHKNVQILRCSTRTHGRHKSHCCIQHLLKSKQTQDELDTIYEGFRERPRWRRDQIAC